MIKEKIIIEYIREPINVFIECPLCLYLNNRRKDIREYTENLRVENCFRCKNHFVMFYHKMKYIGALSNADYATTFGRLFTFTIKEAIGFGWNVGCKPKVICDEQVYFCENKTSNRRPRYLIEIEIDLDKIYIGYTKILSLNLIYKKDKSYIGYTPYIRKRMLQNERI